MQGEKIKVAIIGATSHIAKGLIYSFRDEKSIELHLFARNIEKLKWFLQSIEYSGMFLKTITSFKDDSFNVLINCVGILNIADINSTNENVFEITENYDQICIDYIRKKREVVYINLSSGAVYGTQFNQPASRNAIAGFEVNNIKPEDYYRIAKLNSEIKHRSLYSCSIIDLRIFGYYSRFIDLSKKYLLTEIINSIKEKRILQTNTINIIRDYIHPRDLSELVKLCFNLKQVNSAIDVTSLKPVSKMEILDFFRQNYDLKYEIIDNFNGYSPTGEKLKYYSEYNIAQAFNFNPLYTSIDCLKTESKALFESLS